MSMFTLALFCLTTSNLPWFMDLTFQVPMQIVFYSTRLYFHHLSHPQLGVGFVLAPSLHSFWSYFSTLLQYHIGHLLTWWVHLSVSYRFTFSHCSWLPLVLVNGLLSEMVVYVCVCVCVDIYEFTQYIPLSPFTEQNTTYAIRNLCFTSHDFFSLCTCSSHSFFYRSTIFFLYSCVVIYCTIPPWRSYWLLPNLIMTDSSVVSDLICSFASW